MPHFRQPSGAVHFLEDASFLHLLPEDCVPFTQAEEEAYAASMNAPLSQSQINSLRRSQIQAELKSIDERKVRATTDALLLNDLTRLQALENQAVALRAELATLVP